MADARAEPRPVLPFLRQFYAVVIPLRWPAVRIACGMHLAIHGWGKIMRGGTMSTLAVDPRLGPVPDVIGFFGGLCTTVGLFTRFFAVAAAIAMGYLTFVHYWANGYGWRSDGYEYVMMWGTLAFAIALRGGGPYSVDRVLGREL